MSKYRNIKTVIDGIKFDSKKEANRYQELKLLQKAGDISDLKLQQSYTIIVGDVKVCRYISDFTYIKNNSSESVCEDCKGFRTQTYIIKRKLMKACFGIEILET